MALWEVPNRAASSVERLVGAVGDLPRDVRGLRDTLGSIDETLRAALTAVVAVHEDTSALELRSRHLQEQIGRLEALAARIEEQIPDPDAPSPIARAKDALLGEDGEG